MTRDRQVTWLAVGLILALTVARIVALPFNQTDLYVDEAQYWFWAQTPAFGYYSKPPGIAWVIGATTALFGDQEWAVRLGSPVLHGVTALVLVMVGRRLYGAATGALAGLIYSTLPAVAYSAGVISTDVPLLAAWSIALLFYLRLVAGGGWGSALGLGLAIAFGLNAKYVMAAFIAVALIDLVVTPARRAMLRSLKLWSAFILGLAGLVPNALWNAGHDFATVAHTRDNANWRGGIHFGSLAEFIGGQIGVFGPLMLVLLLLAGIGYLKTARRDSDRTLLVFSLPILLGFCVQALISEANANWAATAYPAATVLVAAILVEGRRPRLAAAAIGINVLASVVLFVAPLVATSLTSWKAAELFTRVLGWKAYADQLRPLIAERGVRTIVVMRRADAADLLYYLRDLDLDIVTQPPRGRPRNHFEMGYAWTPAAPQPALVVAPLSGIPDRVAARQDGEPRTIAVSRGVSKSREMVVTPIAW